MPKTTTNLRLEVITIGYLRYLMQAGETTNIYDIIDVLVEQYVHHYAEINELDIDKIKEEAMLLYKTSRRPQSIKSKKEQELNARKAFAKMNSKVQDVDILGGKENVTFEGDF